MEKYATNSSTLAKLLVPVSNEVFFMIQNYNITAYWLRKAWNTHIGLSIWRPERVGQFRPVFIVYFKSIQVLGWACSGIAARLCGSGQLVCKGVNQLRPHLWASCGRTWMPTSTMATQLVERQFWLGFKENYRENTCLFNFQTRECLGLYSASYFIFFSMTLSHIG